MKKLEFAASSDVEKHLKMSGKSVTRRPTGFCVPPELEAGMRMFEALSDDEHWAVYIALMKHGDMSLNTLAMLFGGTYHELVLITDDLIKGGLIEKFVVWEFDEGNYDRTYYRVTTDGLVLYIRVCEAFFPSRDSSLYKHLMKRREKLGIPFKAV